MQELINISKINRGEAKKRISPILYQISCFNKKGLSHIERYWKDKLLQSPGEYNLERSKILEFINFVPEIPNLLGDLYTMPAEALKEDNYTPLIWAIYKNSLSEYIKIYKNEDEIKKFLATAL